MSNQALPPELAWLGRALGAEPDSGPGHGRFDYVIVPSRSRPQMVLAREERAAAWAALRQHNDASPTRVRVAKELLAWGCRFGLAGTMFPSRVPDSALGLRTGPCAWPQLIEEVFGRSDLGVAVSVGHVRPQIKPILHVATGDGRPIGHIKVGWNDVTIPLIRNEAATLAMLDHDDRASRAFRAPRVLFHGPWHGREVLAVSHVGATPWYQRPRTSLPASATRQVGRGVPVERAALGSSDFWLDLAERIGRLSRHEALEERLGSALAAARDRMESWHASTELDLGLVHGDWAPWNMASQGTGIGVWDWERSRTRGPLGFDGAFFRFQVDLWIRRLPPQEALDRSLRLLPETMSHAGASSAAGSAVLRLVVLEVALRQLEGLVAGVRVPARVYRSLTALLERVGDEGWRLAGTPGAASPSPATAPPRTGPSTARRRRRTPPPPSPGRTG